MKSQQQKLKIYPNPSSEIIDIHFTADAGQFCIIDASGQTIRTQKVKSSFASIDLSALNKGIYYLVHNTENYRYTKSFVKN